MRARMVLSALLKLRNIGILIVAWILLAMLSSMLPLPALFGSAPELLTFAGGLAVYIVFVIQSL